MFNLKVIILCVFVSCYLTVADRMQIGGLFDDFEESQDQTIQTFKQTIALVQTEFQLPDLRPRVVKIPFGNEFEISKNLCKILKNKDGIYTVIGPISDAAAFHAISICDAKEVPYIDTRWDSNPPNSVLNIHPHPSSMSKLFSDLVKEFGWSSFTILYESEPWLSRFSELLKEYNTQENMVTVRRFNLGSSTQGNYRTPLRKVKLSSTTDIILDCSIEVLPEVLTQAQQVGLMTDRHRFLITNPDLHTLDLEPYKHSGVNIIGIRFVDPEKVEGNHKIKFKLPDGVTTDNLTVRSALVHDAVLLFAAAYSQLTSNSTRSALNPFYGNQYNQMQNPYSEAPAASIIQAGPLDCDKEEAWSSGFSIINYMKTTTISGITGEIKFDNQGHRTDFHVEIVKLAAAGIQRAGVWNITKGLQMEKIIPDAVEPEEISLKNKTFIVLTALSQPYGMHKDSQNTLEGNDRYEGFGIELIHELSLILGFNYTFVLQEDNKYGSKQPDGSWNGMLGKIIRGEADLAVTDLTITAEREEAVDFTMPFMNLGISILYKKPSKEKPSLFSFMSPFSNEVWLYLGGSYLGVSLLFFILGRISPSEWDNPFPCIEEPKYLHNQFSFRNSLWFCIGALLQQGSEIAPKAPSTRTVASIWWFFTLIMVSSYTANLAAFLTVEQVYSPVNSAEDLAKNSHGVQYGAKVGGSTLNFFKDADYPVYQKMHEYMMNHPELLLDSNDAGREKVENSNYAYLMESTSIEYIIERHCNLTQVGGLLDDKGYGIAMKKQSPYRGALTEAVLRLQEQGKLTSMKNKWWKEKRGGGACQADGSDDGAVPLGMANVGGVFLIVSLGAISAIFISIAEALLNVKRIADTHKSKRNDDGADPLGIENVKGIFFVLVVGSWFATLYGLIEWIIIIKRRSKKYQVSFKEEFMEEFKFVIRCDGNSKPVRHRKSMSTSVSKQSTTSLHTNQSRYSVGRDHDLIDQESKLMHK